MTGQEIDDIVTGLLQDKAGTQFLPEDRLAWINAGVRDIATHKPKATTISAALLLYAGKTRHVLPTDVIALLDITCNLGATGLIPGRHITQTTAQRLGAIRPKWRSEKGPEVRHFVADDREAGTFCVWPAPPVDTYVDATIHKHPQPITALSETLPLDASYQNALVDFVMHMAFSQEIELPERLTLAGAHYNKYAQTLGIQTARQKKASPGANGPENPAAPVNDRNGA